MNRVEIVSKVNELMSKGFEIPAEKLTPSATLFDDLGLDSLDAIDMLVHLEENIGIKVDVEKMQNVRTLQDIYTMVETLAASANIKSQVSH